MKDVFEILEIWEELVENSHNYSMGVEDVDEEMFHEAMKDAYEYFVKVVEYKQDEDKFLLPTLAVVLYGLVCAYSNQVCALWGEETLLFEASQYAAKMLCNKIRYPFLFAEDTSVISDDFDYVDKSGNSPKPASYDMLNGDLSELVEFVRWLRGE